MEPQILAKVQQLASIHTRLEILMAQINPLEDEKKKVMNDIVQELGDRIQPDNIFELPDLNKVINIKMYERRVFNPEVTDIIKNIKSDAIQQHRFQLRRIFALFGSTLEKYRKGVASVDLETVPKGNIPHAYRTRSSPSTPMRPLNDEELKVFQELRRWRISISQELNLPPYVIAHDRVLHQMILEKVNTPEGLLNVKGFRERKLAKYGDAILKILQKYYPLQ